MKIPPAILCTLTAAALAAPGLAVADVVAPVVAKPAVVAPSPNGKPAPGAVVDPAGEGEVLLVEEGEDDEELERILNSESKPRPLLHFNDCPGCGMG